MAGKSINEYGAFTGNPDAVNILVQEKSQGTDHSQAEHKKADLDALLNKKIVQTITDNDTTHVPSADAVYDALLTESTARANADTTIGQNITAEATARANADTTLGQRINANSKEIANLKQKAGDEIVVNYPDSTYGRNEVPANVAEYAKVSKLRGVSRANNQLMNKANYPASATYGNLSFTNNGDGSFTFSCPTALGSVVQIPIESITPAKGAVSGHTYVFKGGATNINFGTGNGVGILDNGNGRVATITFGTSISMGFMVPQGTVISSPVTVTPLLTDLNTYFNTSDLSFLGATDSAKLATIQTNYPELLIPSDYDTGTRVDTTYSAVKSVGRNRLKPSAFKSNLISWGGTDNGDGTVSIAASLISGKDVWKNETSNNQISIYLKGSNGSDYSNLRIFYTDGTYDAGVRIYSTGGWTLSNANKRVDRIQGEWTSGTTTFVIDSCGIFLGSVNTWSDYFEDTLTLPEPVTGKSAGSVHQIYYPETGEMTEPIGSIADLSTLTWAKNSSGQFYAVLPVAGVSDTTGSNVLCPKYVGGNAYAKTDKTICINGSTNLTLWVCDLAIDSAADLETVLTGVPLLYELATPNPNSQATEPVLDPFLKVEGGGTIEPVQSQSIKIDHAFTAEYLAV